jgi:hypothetical protein
MPTCSAQVSTQLLNEIKKTAEDYKLPKSEILRAMINYFLALPGADQTSALESYVAQSKRGKLYAEKRQLEQRIKEIEAELNGKG